MEEVALLTRIAPHIDETKIEYPLPQAEAVRVTVHPATVRALRRRPLRYDWPEGRRLDY